MFGDNAYSSGNYLGGDNARQVSFVVGDFNHNPTGYVYSRTYRNTGSGAVTHQWEGGSDQLGFNPGSVWIGDYTWPAGNVARMWDLYLYGETNATIEVTDLSGQMDLGLGIFNSNGYSTFWSGRDGGLSRDATGVGGVESMTVAFTVTDWFGILVWNNNGTGGNYRIRVIDAASADVAETIPAIFDLRAITENPFRDSATLGYSLRSNGGAELAVFDLQGRLVRTLLQGQGEPGSFMVQWDGRDDSGLSVASGIYFARLRAGAEEKMIKLVRTQ
jgi:hypothetical protein